MTAKIITLKPAHYHSIDDDIIDAHGQTIGPIGYAVYGYLCRRRNRKTGQCNPSISRIAEAFDIARSTVKVYLRLLEDVGLIEIHGRQDEAGDPTSNMYILLDPSPAAVAKRLMARKAAATFEGGRPPADPPLPERGGLSADLPPADCRPPGRSPNGHEPDPNPEPKKENQPEGACATEKTPETRTSNPCPHPLEERISPGDITICPPACPACRANSLALVERLSTTDSWMRLLRRVEVS